MSSQSTEKAQKRIEIPKPQIHTGPKHLTVDGATVDYLRDAAIRVRVNRYWGSGVTALVADLLDAAADAVESGPAYSYDRCLCPHEDTDNGPGTGILSGYTEGCRVHLAPGTGCQNPACGETWVKALGDGRCESCGAVFPPGKATD